MSTPTKAVVAQAARTIIDASEGTGAADAMTTSLIRAKPSRQVAANAQLDRPLFDFHILQLAHRTTK